jgi:hypothetical protein
MYYVTNDDIPSFLQYAEHTKLSGISADIQPVIGKSQAINQNLIKLFSLL